MVSRTVMIQNRTGLHARPASEFVNRASMFTSRITIRNVNEQDDANAKSIMRLLSLGLGRGDEVVISATGDDEAEAVDALVSLIESKFGEE